MTRVFYSIIYIFLGLNLLSCQEEPGTLSLPNSELDKNFVMAYTDTITLINSTVLLDSIPTNNLGTVLVGKYNDDKLGLVEAKAYLPLVNTEKWTFSNNAVYDKIELIADYSSPKDKNPGYHYGDPTEIQTIEVREITGRFKPDSLTKYWLDIGLFSYFSVGKNNLYNTSTVEVDNDVILGTSSFNPSTDSAIRVPLNYTFGQNIFLKEKSKLIGKAGDILDYFKGVEISGLSQSNVVGVFTNSSGKIPKKTYIRLYYHEFDAVGTPIDKFYDLIFPNTNQYYSYSKITLDRSGTLLAPLTNEDNEIAATETNNETYVQAGTGLATKITFPSLKDLKKLPGFTAINDVRLIIEPITNSFNTDSLPTSLMLFYSNGTNLPLSPMRLSFSQGNQTAKLNYETEGKRSYKFSITQYVQDYLNSEDVNSVDNALLLTVNPGEIGNSVSRAVLGSGKRADFRARLEIYYLKKKE